MSSYAVTIRMLVLMWLLAAVVSVHSLRKTVKPEQVHLAFGSKPNDIVVTWSTPSQAPSVVKYGEKTSAMDHTATGESFKFQDGSLFMAPQWIHNVALKDLKFDTQYTYQVGSDLGWHGNFTFKTPPQGHDWVVNVALYGDHGLVQGNISIPYLVEDVKKQMYDAILHVGDFAYDLHEKGGKQGDQFLNGIEPIVANVPYMTCPGNHEFLFNFTHYSHRFTMPGRREDSSVFYSFDLGPVHFVSISTEVYYEYMGISVIKNQYEWLKEDLAKAASEENRKLRPWLILFGHRPMYCGNKDLDCYNKIIPIRKHMEHLLKDFGVDIAIWAHEHSWERTWPLYNYKVYNGSSEHPYVNPIAPIHIITGSAGSREGNTAFKVPPPEWSAFRSMDRGYTRMKVYNGSHVYMEQVSTEHGGKIIDTFWIVKDKHGPFMDIP